MSRRPIVSFFVNQSFIQWLLLSFVLILVVPANAGNVLQQHLRYQLENTAQNDLLGLVSANQVKQFYHTREYIPLWSDSDELSEHVASFLLAVDAAGQHGLYAQDLHRDKITYLSTSPIPGDMAKLDLLLTDAFFTYARRMGQGQIEPAKFDDDWHYESRRVDPVLLLNQVHNAVDMQRAIQSLQPQHHEYKQLMTGLKYYTEIQEEGGWPQIGQLTYSLEYGSMNADLAVLRQRLQITGDLQQGSVNEPVFDFELEQAVKRFQARHGLMVDGKVGNKTRYALNVPVEKRIDQILLNLERWRWLPRIFSDRYIMVNTADFSLKAYDGNRDPLTMKVVVGKQKRKTPSFSGVMTHVVVNPYWNIPTKLAIEDLIPSEVSRSGYLAKKNIRVFSDWSENSNELNASSINWNEFIGKSYLPYRLRQDPGYSNSLGRIKFMFPNPFSVYMHDTPSKRLFSRHVRTYSSGCVRLEHPIDLVRYLFGGDRRFNRIMSLMRDGKNQRVMLPEPVPVHLLYHTAWTDRDGKIQFRDDVYQKDALIMANMPFHAGRFTFNVENQKSERAKPVSLLKN